jgi:hypothetical protein
MEIFVIKGLDRGQWKYVSTYDDPHWDEDIYFAKRFKSYTEAEAFLLQAFKQLHWGGYFGIEKYFVSR